MDLFGTPEELPEDPVAELSSPASPETEIPLSPRTMNFCLGHDGIEKSLLELYNTGRMPHGLVFTGPKGIGKSTMAYRLARFLFANGVKDPEQGGFFGDTPDATSLDTNPALPASRLVFSSAHPDLLSIERKFDEAKGRHKSGIDVEDARRVTPFLRMTSSNGGWRVVIIDDADTLNRNAQNALLKILEEPPRNTVLILITHRAGALIPTIRSRTRTVSFNTLSESTIRELFTHFKTDLARSQIDRIAALAEGSFGNALGYAESGILDSFAGVITLLDKYPDWPWVEIHGLADTLSGNAGGEQAYENFTTAMLWIFRQLAKAKARGTLLPGLLRGEDGLEKLLQNSSLEQILKICDNLQAHFAKIDHANLDKRQGVQGAFALIT